MCHTHPWLPPQGVQPPGLACCLSNLTSLTRGQHPFHWKAVVHQTQEGPLFNMLLLYLLILYLINFSFLKKASAAHGPPLCAEFSPKCSHDTATSSGHHWFLGGPSIETRGARPVWTNALYPLSDVTLDECREVIFY